MNNKHFFIVIIILVVTAILGFMSYFPPKFNKTPSVKMSNFPKTIGEWISEDIPLSERVYELLETKNLIMRNYKNNKTGDIINLYIIYSQDNRKVSHPPEICLQGEGATIVDKKLLQVTNAIKATKLIMEKGNSKELVMYWYRVNKIDTNSYLKQQLKVAIDRMFGKKTSVALIRVLTEIEDNKQDIALSKIRAFCGLVEPLLDKYVP